jgi:hypothetical protein
MQARPPHTPGVFWTQLFVLFKFVDIRGTSEDGFCKLPAGPNNLAIYRACPFTPEKAGKVTAAQNAPHPESRGLSIA